MAGAIALLAVAAIVFVAIVGKGTVTATDVKVGDCLAEIPDSARVLTVKTVECNQSHAGEVYAELQVDRPHVQLLTRGTPGCVLTRACWIRARAGSTTER